MLQNAWFLLARKMTVSKKQGRLRMAFHVLLDQSEMFMLWLWTTTFNCRFKEIFIGNSSLYGNSSGCE